MPLSLRTPATRPTPTPLPRDVTRAIALLRKSLDRPLALMKLARHCGVAERTLNEHFREYLGVSPARYQRALRLAAARDTLLAGDSGLSVTKVAEQFGFSHFGRFAAQYRKQFGEPPSATLRALSVADDDAAVWRADRTAPHATQSLEKVSLAVLIDHGSSHEPVLRELLALCETPSQRR
jgi:AraC-like DNA-binding protein